MAVKYTTEPATGVTPASDAGVLELPSTTANTGIGAAFVCTVSCQLKAVPANDWNQVSS